MSSSDTSPKITISTNSQKYVKTTTFRVPDLEQADEHVADLVF